MMPSEARGDAPNEIQRLDVVHPELLGMAGGDDDAHHVVDQRMVDEVVGRDVLQPQQVTGVQDLLGLRWPARPSGR